MSLITQDNGIVILDTENNTYYCGLNTWDKQLRKAKIYHKDKWADDVMLEYSKKGKSKLTKLAVSIKVVG